MGYHRPRQKKSYGSRARPLLEKSGGRGELSNKGYEEKYPSYEQKKKKKATGRPPKGPSRQDLAQPKGRSEKGEGKGDPFCKEKRFSLAPTLPTTPEARYLA